MYLPRQDSTNVSEAATVISCALVYSRVRGFLVEELLLEQEEGWIESRVCNAAGETTKLSSVSLSQGRAIHMDIETSQMPLLLTPALGA